MNNGDGASLGVTYGLARRDRHPAVALQPDARPIPAREHWRAILRQRCPRCCEGRVFRGSVTMYEHCPVCGLRYEREPGYFFGAMYASYPLAALILGPCFYLAYRLFPDWELHWLLLLAYVPFLPFVPLVFRYSRVLWLHFDHWAAPSSASESEGWERWCRLHESGREDG
jgi:uncharacterized protein (DUF983 family)